MNSNIFDYLNAITYKKDDIMEENLFAEQGYDAYRINKFLSEHPDCIMHTNEMNYRPFADRKLQFDYLINKVRKKFRKANKWLKAEVLDDIKYVKEYFNISTSKAKVALNILTDKQLEFIKYKLRKGGKDE
tara:strand:+ start:1882 stop:2274 length:393 start_codon:yes stop_codon:yes gene_type:complete